MTDPWKFKIQVPLAWIHFFFFFVCMENFKSHKPTVCNGRFQIKFKFLVFTPKPHGFWIFAVQACWAMNLWCFFIFYFLFFIFFMLGIIAYNLRNFVPPEWVEFPNTCTRSKQNIHKIPSLQIRITAAMLCWLSAQYESRGKWET